MNLEKPSYQLFVALDPSSGFCTGISCNIDEYSLLLCTLECLRPILTYMFAYYFEIWTIERLIVLVFSSRNGAWKIQVSLRMDPRACLRLNLSELTVHFVARIKQASVIHDC